MKLDPGMTQINVVLSEELHRRVKSKATAMNIKVKEAYTDALERWAATEDPASELTLSELRAISAFLRRAKEEDILLRNLLIFVLNRRYS